MRREDPKGGDGGVNVGNDGKPSLIVLGRTPLSSMEAPRERANSSKVVYTFAPGARGGRISQACPS